MENKIFSPDMKIFHSLRNGKYIEPNQMAFNNTESEKQRKKPIRR